MLIENSHIIKKIKELLMLSDSENIKLQLYSIFTAIILSKDIFKSNTDVSIFLQEFGIEFKQYVIASRTLMLSRVLREFEKADESKIRYYANTLIKITIGDPMVRKTSNRRDGEKMAKEDTYINSILHKYSRRKG